MKLYSISSFDIVPFCIYAFSFISRNIQKRNNPLRPFIVVLLTCNHRVTIICLVLTRKKRISVPNMHTYFLLIWGWKHIEILGYWISYFSWINLYEKMCMSNKKWYAVIQNCYVGFINKNNNRENMQ